MQKIQDFRDEKSKKSNQNWDGDCLWHFSWSSCSLTPRKLPLTLLLQKDENKEQIQTQAQIQIKTQIQTQTHNTNTNTNTQVQHLPLLKNFFQPAWQLQIVISSEKYSVFIFSANTMLHIQIEKDCLLHWNRSYLKTCIFTCHWLWGWVVVLDSLRWVCSPNWLLIGWQKKQITRLDIFGVSIIRYLFWPTADCSSVVMKLIFTTVSPRITLNNLICKLEVNDIGKSEEICTGNDGYWSQWTLSEKTWVHCVQSSVDQLILRHL